MNETVTAFPAPPSDRWRPTRAGLVALWRYWDETFTFHHGRLLLRGPNGSGKSMALELLLPFLLDANASPERLTSAAKSRGGLFERVMTGTDDATRAGYTWVEFQRGSDVFTVGARMRASLSTRKVDLDFFTTSQAVGADLHLLDEQRVPLSRKALIDAIGSNGRVHSSGDEHRVAVRDTLFPGFGPDRYASVITALLALRKEKLSQNLDLDKLSGVLSEALPPLDDHDLAIVAEGFERLDRRRAELTALEAEQGEVRALASRQRTYARAVVAGLAGDVRSAESRRDAVTRVERTANENLGAANTELVALQLDQESLDDRLSVVDVEIDALKSSEAYGEGAKLDDLRNEARRLRELVGRDERAAQQRAAELAEHEQRLSDASQAVDDAMANRNLAADDLGRAASEVGGEGVVSEARDAAARAGIDGDFESGELLIRAWIGRRRQLIELVRVAVDSHRSALQLRRFSEEQVNKDTETVDRRAGAHVAATADAERAVTKYATDVIDWANSLVSVNSARALAVLPVPPDKPSIVDKAVARLSSELAAEHATSLHDIERRRTDSESELHSLHAERALFADGRLVEPESPGWRTDRSDRTGAPLWRVVDLAENVPSEDVDGLEAALTGSGLIDAWINIDGSLDLNDRRADIALGARPVDGPSLADVLVPLDDATVAPSLVGAILRSVRLVDSAVENGPQGHDVAIGRDGTFRIGAAAGRGPDRAASVLGSAAQERHRLTRLAELDRAIAEVDNQLRLIERERDVLVRAETAALAEIAARPSGATVESAMRSVDIAAMRLTDAESALAEKRRLLVAAEDEVRRCLRELTQLASQHHLPTEAGSLAEIETALSLLERAAGSWTRRARECVTAERGFARARSDLERVQLLVVEALENCASSNRDAAAVEAKVAALESTIGAEYHDILQRIETLSAERVHGKARLRKLGEDRPHLERVIGGLEASVRDAALERERADDARASAHRCFVTAMRDGFAADAALSTRVDPDSLDGITNVLTAGRAVAAELDGVTHDSQAVQVASSRLDERLHQTRAALGGRVDLTRELSDEGWWMLHSMSMGIRRSIAELAAALDRELAEGRAEFLAEEERLFEQVLAGSVRRALASRIRLANRLVDAINAQLGAVRTAAGGVQVRLKWEVDPDQLDAVKSARNLLLRDPADLSESETASLQAFVRARVDQARAELEANAPWEARLRETLDYRAWHRFTLQLGHRDWEGFQPATARRLQRLSTGERSITLHLPMLASIAAHYAGDDGEPSACPRLILLDELFAGVDSANRSQLFGTFTAWDLDAVFTSDHEWCQYATLDGIAIHYLHPPTSDEPVTSTRFTWDGRQRSLDPTAA